MDYFTKKRLVIWGFIILIIINLSALGTIAYFRFFKPPVKACAISDIQRPMHSVWQKLNLTENQENKINVLRREFRSETKFLMDSLNIMRFEIVKEIGKKEPDLQYLDKMTEIIGNLHTQLKKESIHHLLEMKTICTPEQHRELTRLFLESMREGDNVRPGMGMGMGNNPENNTGHMKRHGRKRDSFRPADTSLQIN
ncbi:MAG: Spy/CpxP family protein refolding chaperone [Bacteroidales bacterium]|nr:Spy/CpxP family protein refolding chaperone [Bacteroidales bacterium]